MAFWIALLDHDDHPRAACRAALKMRDRVKELNDIRRIEAAGKTYYPLNIGIGIGTGSCMFWNMVSDGRFDYTAMGNPVNLASRLKAKSRFHGKTILVGSSTYETVCKDFALLELDLIRLKGKSQAERAYGLLGGAEMLPDKQFMSFRCQ